MRTHPSLALITLALLAGGCDHHKDKDDCEDGPCASPEPSFAGADGCFGEAPLGGMGGYEECLAEGHYAGAPGEPEACLDRVPEHGLFTLYARDAWDYESATASFKFGTTHDLEGVYNNWDLLFGNDAEPGEDLFDVRMVTDDRSGIVDLGPISFCDIPEGLPEGHPTDLEDPEAERANRPQVVRGHTYLVHTLDDLTEQYAAFHVLAHEPDDWVEIRWHRSASPSEYTRPDFCFQ